MHSQPDEGTPDVLVRHQHECVKPSEKNLMEKVDKLNKKRILALSAVQSAKHQFQGMRNMQPRETRARFDAAMNNLENALKELDGEPLPNWGDGLGVQNDD